MNTDDPALLSPDDIDSAARIVGIFFAYLATARIGMAIYPVSGFTALIWLPVGIALAAFLLYGFRVWPAIFAAAFMVHISFGTAVPAALGIAVGSTLGPAIGAALLKWYSAFSTYHPAFPRLRDSIGILMGACLIPAITTSIAILSLWTFDSLVYADLGDAISAWWLGDMLGILIITPFILKWFNKPLFERTQKQQFELLLTLAAVAATSYFIFWFRDDSLVFYIFIPLTWAALRTGPRGTTLSVLLVSLIGTTGTLAGYGPFAGHPLIYLQLLLITVSGIMLVFSSTVEERRSVFETLEHRAQDLEIALQTIRSEDEAKKEFIAVLAHELRNPLATVLSSIELINLQGISAPNTPMLLTTIDERARAMVRLLDDLLDISRISKKKLILHKETLSFNQFLDKLESIVVPLMKRYGHNFALRKPSEEMYLNADPIRLEQILMNLLANAARYTKTRGSIEVISQKEDAMLAIHIRDSGVGIPRGMLRRIFEPFFQIDRTQVSNEGMGIGLTLTRDLVEMHGGTIEARSGGIGMGSEFVVRLPLYAVADTERMPHVSPPLARTRTRVAPKHVKHTHKILIVDDNEAATEALSQLLGMRGHTTAVVYTGAGAVQKALEFAPDVIFLDIGLPDMNGYEVAEALRKQGRPYFIVALTGYGQDDDKAKARKAGIDEHLTKPAGIKEIQGVLRKFPKHQRNDRE